MTKYFKIRVSPNPGCSSCDYIFYYKAEVENENYLEIEIIAKAERDQQFFRKTDPQKVSKIEEITKERYEKILRRRMLADSQDCKNCG